MGAYAGGLNHMQFMRAVAAWLVIIENMIGVHLAISIAAIAMAISILTIDDDVHLLGARNARLRPAGSD